MTDSAHELQTPWWLRPVYIFVCLNMTVASIAWWIDDGTHAIWRTAKYFGAQEFGIVLVASIAYLLGDYLGAVSKTSLSFVGYNLNAIFKAVCAVSILGYPIWFVSGVLNGLTPYMLYSFFIGEPGMSDEIKDAFVTIPGVTTITQFAIVAASLYPFLRSVSFVDRWMLQLLISLCLVRAILLSERLAFIEVMIPLLIAFFARWYTRATSRKRNRINFIGPIILVVSLLMLFAFAEYFRSWQYYQADYESFWQFMVSRLSSYYVTALNNGALLLQQMGVLPCPFFSISALWRFPLLPESLSYERFFGRDPYLEYFETLRVYSTDELNNGSGIFIPLIDFGFAGFVVYWIAMALAARVLFRAYCRSSLVGQLFFPLFLISVLESPRIPYLTNTRAFPAIVGSIAVLAVSRIRFRR